MVNFYLVVLTVVALERLLELLLSARNARAALAQGGVEYGQRHFVFMKLLHTIFLLSCAAEVILWKRPFFPALGFSMFGLLLAAQALRYWAILTLGQAWNVRVIVVPGSAACNRGPYRFFRHPNYLAVVIEGFVLPLIHTAWMTALVFTILNAVLLIVRIRTEEKALMLHSDYAEKFAQRRRFWPDQKLWMST